MEVVEKMMRCNKKIFTIVLLVLLCVSSLFFINKQGNALDSKTEENLAEYTIMDNYCYEIENPFELSPDSFEAWIKLPKGSLGGTIMSNYPLGGTGYSGIVSWNVTAFGKMNVYWDDGRFQHTFNNNPLDDNLWHHVAIIRDEASKSFDLYIDAELVESFDCITTEAPNAKLSMRVGVGMENYNKVKSPLEGYIKQITIYNGAITEDRVISDMQNTDIKDDLDGRLIGNWYFGEVWTERNIKESSGNGNDAKICTFDKYVGVASKDFQYDYSLVILGDIQSVVDGKQDKYNNMIKWIANNIESEKIKFVIQTGDLTNSGTLNDWNVNDVQYFIAASGLSQLDNKVPYCFAPGNHDYDYVDSGDRSQIHYATYFPYEKHSKLPGFGGAYIEGDMANTYYEFSACGVNYLVINLEYEPRMPIVRWANRLCEMYPQHRVIINTHSYIDRTGGFTKSNLSAKDGGLSSSGQELYDDLVKRHKNIFMVICGHVAHDDVVVRYDTGDHGNKITTLLVNPQGTKYDSGMSEDLVFMMNFNEMSGVINCYYYSPYHDAAWNIQNQFRLSF